MARTIALQLAVMALLLAGAGFGAVPAGAQPAPPERVDGEPEGEVADVAVQRVAGADRITTAVAVSESVFEASDTVLLARADDPADALVGAPLAARSEGPVLLSPSDELPAAVADELERLDAEQVVVLGGTAAIGTEVADELEDLGYDVDRVAGDDRFQTAAAIAERLGTVTRVGVANGFSPPDALAAAAWAAGSGRAILLTAADAVPEATAEALDELDPQEVTVVGGSAVVDDATAAALGEGRTLRRLAGGSRYDTAAQVRDVALQEEGTDAGTLWLATGSAFADALVAGPAIAAAGGTLLLVDGADLGAAPEPAQRIRTAADEGTLEQIVLLGGTAAISGGALGQLEGIINGAQLPGGGRTLFPDRRMVAFYGNARTSALGVLGEQPPEAAAERLLGVAARYHTPERPILPTFELIATVAQRDPGPDGDYSAPATDEEIQQYLDTARRHGFYLVLDIQPGLSDFLTEVRRYERFLEEPDVGVALDPEWRMSPGQVPGQTVGSVDAAEVNQVVDYLAGIVERRNLPEKLLIVHQFQHRMVTNRHLIRAPEGVAVLIHADGFGTQALKLDTYAQIAADPPLWNGFKLFYDEDTNLFSPQQVLQIEPPVDFVSYQ